MKASRNPVRSSWIERASPGLLAVVGLGLLAVGGLLVAPTLARWRFGGDLGCALMILGIIGIGYGANLLGECLKRLLGMGVVGRRQYQAPASEFASPERHPLFPKPPRGMGRGRWYAIKLPSTQDVALREIFHLWAGLAVIAIPLAMVGGWLLEVGGETGPHVILWLCVTGVLYFARRMVLTVVPSLGPVRLFVELSHEPVEPGQVVRVGVAATREINVQALRVSAVCRELASHGSGSDRVTKTHDAREIELLAMGAAHGGGNRLLADFAWQVPVDAMHSLAATNNEVAWVFVVGAVEKSGAAHAFKVPFQIKPTKGDRGSPTP